VDPLIEESPHAASRASPPARRFPRLATTPRSSICRVALIYDARRIYDIKVMAGVAAYLRERDRYSVLVEGDALQGRWPPDLLALESDGIIAGVDDPVVAKAVLRSGLPAVGFGGGCGWHGTTSPMPYFSSHNPSIAVAAAEHLLQRGFKHFAFCGYAPTPVNVNGWSAERERARQLRPESGAGRHGALSDACDLEYVGGLAG
jgi:DNA-binding LacI/PurR family transcriptional regulator